MKLSIITISFNTKEVLRDCLNSLWEGYKQELHKKQFEVIVVDNGSTDGSPELLKKDYSWVKLIESKHNVGFSKANNVAIKKSTGEYVLFLNPDTEVPALTLVTVLTYMDKYADTGIATAKVLLKDGTLDDASHRGFPTPLRALLYFIGLANLFPKNTFFNGYHLGYQRMDEIHEIDACAGAFLLIKRSVGDAVDWFDEDYFWYGEDLDLCYKVKQKGYKVVFIPTVSITHLKGAASGLKKHSASLAKIDPDTKRKITEARFEVMRIFYRKHYAQKYPQWLTQLIFTGINLKQKLTKLTV